MDEVTERSLARYMVMETAFETEGWHELVRELEDEIEVIKTQLLQAANIEEVKFLQGRAQHCMQMIYLPDTVANVRAALLDEVEGDA